MALMLGPLAYSEAGRAVGAGLFELGDSRSLNSSLQPGALFAHTQQNYTMFGSSL